MDNDSFLCLSLFCFLHVRLCMYVDILLNLRMLDGISWAEFVYPQGEPIVTGMVCATLVKCYRLLWTFNPCRIVCREKNIISNQGKTIYSQLAISTLEGHLIEGEELFRVDIDATNRNGDRDKSMGNVTISLLSFTKGSGILGSMVMPLIRPLQNYFFDDVMTNMKSLMEMEKEDRNNYS